MQPQLAQAKAAPDGMIAAKARASYVYLFMKFLLVMGLANHTITEVRPFSALDYLTIFSAKGTDVIQLNTRCEK